MASTLQHGVNRHCLTKAYRGNPGSIRDGAEDGYEERRRLRVKKIKRHSMVLTDTAYLWHWHGKHVVALAVETKACLWHVCKEPVLRSSELQEEKTTLLPDRTAQWLTAIVNG